MSNLESAHGAVHVAAGLRESRIVLTEEFDALLGAFVMRLQGRGEVRDALLREGELMLESYDLLLL